jgi:AraC family transcriptional regulator
MVLNELNHVIEYIEDNLTDDLSLEKISVFAGVPDHHFRKIFFYLSGLTLSEYIKNKPAFNLVGVSKRVPMQFEGVNDEIVNLAESITDEQKKEMHSLQNIEPYEIVNASYDADANFLKEEGYLTHLIGVLTTENKVSDLLEKVPVEACTWAIFPNEGPFPSTLQQTMAKIYSKWLPSSNYEVINAPSFSFTKMNGHKKENAYSEIWIPVRKNG